MWASLQLILLCAALVRGEEPDNLEEEGYLLAGDIFHLPEGSGGLVEGSAEGSVDVEPEVVSYPRLRNITIFPACISDNDCNEGYKCFQYMCYPWKQVSGWI